MYANPSRQQGSHLPGYAVRRKMGSKHRLRCNGWTATLMVMPPRSIVWGDQHRTLVPCGRAGVHEGRYLAALLGATRWRREERTLILENDTDILRFQLAPF